MYIDDVLARYHKGYYENKMDYPRVSKLKYREGHVFDEDKSVKWNKEEVIRKNKEAEDEVKKYKAESTRLYNQMVEDIIEALVNQYPSLSREQAEKIYSKAYADKHAYFGDVFHEVEELAEFFIDMQDMNK